MATAQIRGVDVSSYQPGYRPGNDVDFVFVKATEGTTYTNPSHTQQVKNARAKGCMVGHYHFLSHGNIAAQAAYFVQQAKPAAGDLLVCDWEKAGCTTADKDQFIRAVQKARPHNKVGLYCNTSWWTGTDTTGFYGDFLWIAAYGPKPTIKTPFKFWQYTDKPIDTNYGYFASRAALKTWANAKTSTPSKGAPVATIKYAPYHGAAAVRRALSLVGHSYGIGWCQKFTNELFGTGAVGDYDGDRDADAVDGWKKAVANGHVVKASAIKSLSSIPAATMLYWSGGSHGYGHAAVSVGGGQMVSTDLPNMGRIGKVPISLAHDRWGLTFLGYVTKEGNGYTLTDPPSAPPAGGGGAGGTPAPKGLFGMSKITKTDTRKDQKLPARKWHTLQLEDKTSDVTIVFGPALLSVTAQVEVDNLPDGADVQLRFYTAAVKGDKATRSFTYPSDAIAGSSGDSFGSVHIEDTIGDTRLRVEAWTSAAGVVVKRVFTRSLTS